MVKLLIRSLDIATDHVGNALFALYCGVVIAAFAIAVYSLL